LRKSDFEEADVCNESFECQLADLRADQRRQCELAVDVIFAVGM